MQTARIAARPSNLPHIEVAARLAQLSGNMGQAEEIYVGNGRPAAAVQMYQSMLKWEDAIR